MHAARLDWWLVLFSPASAPEGCAAPRGRRRERCEETEVKKSRERERERDAEDGCRFLCIMLFRCLPARALTVMLGRFVMCVLLLGVVGLIHASFHVFRSLSLSLPLVVGVTCMKVGWGGSYHVFAHQEIAGFRCFFSRSQDLGRLRERWPGWNL